MERHMRVLLALMLVLARLVSCADSQPSVLRVQGRGRHAGAKSGSRQLMRRCGGPPPPLPPPPPADCTVCADGKYLEASCDRARNRDRVCTSCLSCGAGEYRFGCTHTSAGSCSTCSHCSTGAYAKGCADRSAGLTCNVCLHCLSANIACTAQGVIASLSPLPLSSTTSSHVLTCMHSLTDIHTCLHEYILTRYATFTLYICYFRKLHVLSH